MHNKERGDLEVGENTRQGALLFRHSRDNGYDGRNAGNRKMVLQFAAAPRCLIPYRGVPEDLIR